MQTKGYSVEDYLKKTPAHISVMSLLMSFEAQKNSLIEVLCGVSIPKKMVESEILKYGYQPKTGLGLRADGIVEPIQLKHQKGTTYGPISRGAYSKGFGVTVLMPAQVPVSEQTIDEDIMEGIGNMFVAEIK
ncbi:hypothetical protein BC332_28245 [Capsicum chinense]|nr:hypothetical protein BC332_28245 [Capsicum chinense]